MKGVNRAVAPMFTVSPLKRGGARSLFSTHPPTEERVRVLRSMAGRAGYADYEAAYSSVQGKRLLGRRTLADSKPLSARQASTEPEKDELEKARDAVDILHRLNGYLFLACTCGLKTKVPPSYKGSEVHCPRCGRTVPLPAAMLAGAIVAGEIAQAAADKEEVPRSGARRLVKHAPGEWTNFRCDCGHTVQLSPSFQASRARCTGCGRIFEVEQA
jgi:heat shock protein HtpX